MLVLASLDKRALPPLVIASLALAIASIAVSLVKVMRRCRGGCAQRRR